MTERANEAGGELSGEVPILSVDGFQGTLEALLDGARAQTIDLRQLPIAERLGMSSERVSGARDGLDLQ